MDKKLTLSINQEIIQKAKRYAKSNHTSLSKMIETYFEALTMEEESVEDIEVTPLVDSLCGIIELPTDFDYKSEKTKYLIDKYQ